MAHKTRINGTNYSITGGKTKVGGTNYSVKGGKTLVGGTVRTISFGPELVEFYIFDGYMVPMECSFTAEVGMTWEDWINSDYVTPNDWGVTNGNFEIRNDLVYFNGKQFKRMIFLVMLMNILLVCLLLKVVKRLESSILLIM